MFAKSLSYANKIPLIPVNHIEGHIFSNFIENDIELPAISLIVSGGHTDLYYIEERNGKIAVDLLGETLDDAVGESYDKIARILELPYPGGPEIEKISPGGKNILNIKKPNVEGYNFSFSGIKTYVTNYINKEKMKGNNINKEDIAKSFQEIIVEVLYDKVLKAVNKKSVNTLLVAGGVSANKRLRKKFEELPENMKVYFPKMEYCTDNGAMIGAAAYYKLKNEKNRENISVEENVYNLDAKSTKEKNKR